MRLAELEVGKDYCVKKRWGLGSNPKPPMKARVVEILDKTHGEQRVLVQYDADYNGNCKREYLNHVDIASTWTAREKHLEADRLRQEKAEQRRRELREQAEKERRAKQDYADKLMERLERTGVSLNGNNKPVYLSNEHGTHPNDKAYFRFSAEEMEALLDWGNKNKADGLGRIFN